MASDIGGQFMLITEEGMLPPSSIEMRSAPYVCPYAAELRDEPGSRTQKYGRIVGTVHAWKKAGGVYRTPHGVEIDLTSSLSWRDPHVYPVDRGRVFKELQYFKLLEPAYAFREDPKGGVRRIEEKADGMATTLDIRMLSAIFWAACFLVIKRERPDLVPQA
ncbi:MAG: hypothetical protein AAF330_05720 [Pseudomonadota bacterium]